MGVEEGLYEGDLDVQGARGREKVMGAGALPLPFQLLRAWVVCISAPRGR
jgi:hypothetical protein